MMVASMATPSLYFVLCAICASSWAAPFSVVVHTAQSQLKPFISNIAVWYQMKHVRIASISNPIHKMIEMYEVPRWMYDVDVFCCCSCRYFTLYSTLFNGVIGEEVVRLAYRGWHIEFKRKSEWSFNIIHKKHASSLVLKFIQNNICILILFFQ